MTRNPAHKRTLRDKIAFYDSSGRPNYFWFFWLPVTVAFTIAIGLTVISVMLSW